MLAYAMNVIFTLPLFLISVQTEEDILLREELEKMNREHENFSLWFTLDRPGEGEGHEWVWHILVQCAYLSSISPCVTSLLSFLTD